MGRYKRLNVYRRSQEKVHLEELLREETDSGNRGGMEPTAAEPLVDLLTLDPDEADDVHARTSPDFS